jgi:geranylgeranylglycerol-phosphate geranylgeranyltransferase
MVGFAVLVGIAVASHNASELVTYTSLAGFLTGFCISSFSMVSNDIYDVAVDRINQPQRPIPSGRISIRRAWSLAVFFLIAGIVASATIGIFNFAIACVFALIGWSYNYRLKRFGLAGNSLVALSVAIPYVYGSIAVGSLSINLTYSLALTSFLAGIGREVLKGISDTKGDRVRSIRSIALTRGVMTAEKLTAFFFACAVVSSLIPVVFPNLLGRGLRIYEGVILVPDAIFVFLAARVLSMRLRNDLEKKATKMKGFALLGMLAGLLAYLVAGLAF